MAAAPRARPLCTQAADRQAEDGLRRADRCLAARSVAGMGRDAARAGATCIRRALAGRAGAPRVAGARRRQPQLAISAVDRADAPGLAREMGVTPRPRKIVYVTAGLRGGGAEAMLTRLVTARPGGADEITVVSLIPAEADVAHPHVERLRAGGAAVGGLDFRRGDRLGH